MADAIKNKTDPKKKRLFFFTNDTIVMHYRFRPGKNNQMNTQ